MENEHDIKSFHRMPSERRRKLWSLAARAAVKCPDDVEKDITTQHESSLIKESGSLAKTQDSGVSVDFAYDNQPYSTAYSPFTSHSHCRISLDNESAENYDYGRLSRGVKRFYDPVQNVTLSADLSDTANIERGRSYVTKRKSVFSIPHIPSHISSASANMRRIRKASKQFDTSIKHGSADTSGLGSSLDWVSLETGQTPFYRKMSSQYVHNPRTIITVHKSLDEKQTTRPLVVKKHLTSDDGDTERYLLQEFPLKIYTSTIAPGNPQEPFLNRDFVKSSQHRQKPVKLQQPVYQPDYHLETTISVSESGSPYRSKSDIPPRRTIRDPHMITRSFDQAYYAHNIPYNHSNIPTTNVSRSDEGSVPLTYFDQHETINWPIFTETDVNLSRYASGLDDDTREKMLTDMRNRSVHWGPIYRKDRRYYPKDYHWMNQQQRKRHEQQKSKTIYRRSHTLGDSAENIDTDWMPTRSKAQFKTQLYTTPPPTDEKEAYYNGLLMEHKLKEPHMDFQTFCRLRRFGRFNEKYHFGLDTGIRDESQRLLRESQDSFHLKPTYSTRRRWTSAEIPEVKVSPVFADSAEIKYGENEREDHRTIEHFDQVYPIDVHNYTKYTTGRKRPYHEQFSPYDQHRIAYEDEVIKRPWSQTHKTDRYLTPHRGDSLRKALSLDKPSYIPTPLHKPSSSQQYYHSSPEQLKHPEESLESKFTRQQHFKYHIPYYSSSFDYPSLSSSKTRPLIHPGYIQTYNFFSPIEEKGDFESETKGHPLMSRFNEDKDDICEKNEKIYPMQIKDDHGLAAHKQKSASHVTTDITGDTSNHSSQKKIYQSPLKKTISPSASTDDIIPYDRKSFISHKEVRINESQTHEPTGIKKSVTLSNDINIKQSPQTTTRHTTTMSSSGILKVSVHLGESEIQEFAEYWDHSIFSGARITAVCLAGVASVCLVCSVCASTWLYQGYANNITHSGFWKRCNYFNQTCEIMLPFITKHEGWQDGAFFILVLAILLGFLGLSLSVAGHLVYALPKRLYYFHSGGEAHVVAAFVTALSVLIYHITIKLHLRTEGPVNFGEAYGISWFACFLHIMAAILLLLDEIINELVNLARRVHCVRTCLKCIIHTYSKTVQKKRQLFTHYNIKFYNDK
ncbi:hypothetical protein MS3_00010061 [Schistosoma haematobium]|uniref:Uncharacterized protein n=2 Tax=Schistosoma haematobium TaxID=6185 RepID=A0A922LU15_SCHHA|nr:hypothetical protein MS3_00010061 [Schistosoma haematobium]KAH9593984.1 hypothetical protein MS3_00010061 [Schistosoma haematobium]